MASKLSEKQLDVLVNSLSFVFVRERMALIGNGMKLMSPLFGFLIRLRSVFCGNKVAKVVPFAIDANLRDPFSKLGPANPKVTAFISLSYALVLDLLPSCGFSKVFPSIIRSNSIDVINLCGPSAIHIEERKPMEVVRPILYSNDKVSSFIRTSSNGPNRFLTKANTALGVSKKTCIRLVYKPFSELFVSNKGLCQQRLPISSPRGNIEICECQT